jgi:hypothetical protein
LSDEHRHVSKLLRFVMHQVAKELRDDPEFTNPVYERLAARIIAHAFALFAKWLGVLAIGSIGAWFLIWLGAQGVFTK